jgi:phospholipid/cholesterol/gamma-HCH transport system substrate-binding protein
MQSAARVGLFVVIFLGLLLGAYAVLGQSVFAPKVSRYYAELDDVAGMAPGSRILVAGVKVGNIGEVELVSPTKARLTLLLDPKFKLPTGTMAEVPTSLIGFGDSALVLKPPAEANGFVAEGGTIAGRKAGALDGILPDTEQTMKELNATLVEARKVLADPALTKDVKKLLSNTEKTIGSFGRLADRMDMLLAKNDRSVNLALTRGAAAVADVQRITASVAKMMEEGTIQKDTKQILGQLVETSKKADQLVANMNSLVADGSIKQTTANVAEITKTGKSIAANVDEMTKTGKSIAEKADKITENGVAISANVVDLTERTKKVIDGAVEIEGQVKGLLDKLGGVLGPNKGPKIPPVTTSMDLMRETEPGRYRTDFNARIGLSHGNTLDIGLFDAFEGNKLTVQYGTPVDSKLSYRYGIYAAKAGLGVDYQIAPKLFLRNDLWNINNPRYDARLRADFGGGLYGWMGMDRIFQKNSPTFGIGIRR